MITSIINTLWSDNDEFKRLKQPSQDIADQGTKVAVLHFLLVHQSDFLRQFPLNMVKVQLNFFLKYWPKGVKPSNFDCNESGLLIKCFAAVSTFVLLSRYFYFSLKVETID